MLLRAEVVRVPTYWRYHLLTNSPLSGDPRRRASATLRGFAYQLWHTVDAWLALEAGQILYAEGVEDFDVVGQTHATPVQIKNDAASGRLTLGTGKALAALQNFWTARRKNRGTPIHYKYLTTAELGREREI